MQKILSLLILFLSTISASAQQPVIKVNNKDSGKVEMNSLKIDVKVVGNIAITTMEMQFCNSSKRVLEGELTFPMPEGVSISRYAIDMNGAMREAVPVEKEKGQVAFENTIKRKVDPGLLEKVEGNNFRTRIYPLPAGGCRTVIIAYQEALFANNANELSYNLPLQFRKSIDNFSFAINVFSKNQPEIGKSCNTNLKFTESKNVFNASITEKDFKPNGSFKINMPKLANDEDVLMQKVGNDYFFLANHFPQYKSIEKKLPTTVHIIWDNSFSGLNRDHKKEIEFIKAYAAKMQNGSFVLSTIGYTFENNKTFSITNGSCKELMDVLQNIIYDGATNLSLLQWNVTAEEHLLFSDGMNTYGNFLTLSFPTNTLHTITASPTANFSNLQYMANKTGGQFINLNTLSTTNALKNITQMPLRLINVATGNSTNSIYPSYGIVKGNMAVSGISITPIAEIILQYGYGNTVSYEEKVQLNYDTQQTTDIALDKIWAAQKIAQLDEQYDVFKNIITDLGKKYNLVTRNTSLIVLDDVADYAKYEIEPPAELKAAYDSIMLEKATAAKEQFENSLASAKQQWTALQTWWEKDYDSNITGTVTGENGEALSGVKVTIGFTTVYTNKEGYFIVKDYNGKSINISYANYYSEKIDIDKYENNYAISLRKVVVVKYDKNGKKLPPPPSKIESIKFISPSVVADSLRQGYFIQVPDWENDQNGTKAMEMRSIQANNIAVSSGESYLFASGNVKTVRYKNKDRINNNATIEIKEIASNKPFIKTLKETATANRYAKYLELRKDFLYTPSFYFEVARFFFTEGDKAIGLKILSNVADLNLEDHELYKMLGYQLKLQSEYDEAVNVFKKVVQWRPQEPQSYRDYGLALQDAGKYQQALDTLYTAITKTYDADLKSNYDGIEETIVTEINNIITLQKNIKASTVDKELISDMPVDVRVVLNWNMNDTDMDLWVTDPLGEKCYYSNNLTKIGGHISRDFTRGYGPEQFMLKKARNGKYKVQLHYYGDGVQKISGGSTVMAEIYTNYGTPSQVRKLIALQMEKDGEKEGILVGEFTF
jgi:Vault protein inter-alpha-trypsin domain/Uncharacterized protein conserved in bacteria (DUF2135)